MVVLTSLLTLVILQITPGRVIGDEVLNPGADDQYVARMQMNKRYVGSLAKNKHPPTVQQRSYFVPPLVSPYGNQRPSTIDDFDAKGKRYLGALARAGDLNFSKPQQKKTIDAFEDAESPAQDEYQLRNLDDLPDRMLMRQETIKNLEPIILGHLKDSNKEYDPDKVTLFLSNVANAMFDQNYEDFSNETLKSLVLANYFQPEEDFVIKDESKRDVRAGYKSYGGATQPTHPFAQEYYSRREQDDERVKRNLQSLLKNKAGKRHLGSPARLYLPRVLPKRRDPFERLLSYWHTVTVPRDEDLELPSHLVKRHTMYDINEPDITFEYPTQPGDLADYSDYAEQDTHPISIGKRYLGALARNGWLPQGFATLRSSEQNASPFEKKHIGSLAQIGWLPSVRTAASPTNYYHYNYLRNDRQREFRPPLYRGPRAHFLKSEPPAGRTKVETSCKCKRNADASRTSAVAWPYSGKLGQVTSSASEPAPASSGDVSTGNGAGLLSKRFMLMPAVDHYLFRKLYPDKLLQTTYNGFPAAWPMACTPDSPTCSYQ